MTGITLVKIGGRPLAEAESLDILCRELTGLAARIPLALVHGGGSEVSRVSRRFGLEPRFVDGLRQTSREEMDVVEMVLAGSMNTLLVRSMVHRGLKAVGLTGCDAGLLTAQALSPESRTGRIGAVDITLLTALLQGGYIPVCSSVAMDADGDALNINADEAALELAAALGAARLIYLSDVPGIMLEGKVVNRLDRKRAEKKIAEGEIAGGMIPKVRSSFEGLARGIGEIIIGSCSGPGELRALIEGAGTHLYLNQERENI
jgi:acetylglutamate kinase